MFSNFRILAAAAVVLLLSACATAPAYMALDPAIKPKVTSTHVTVTVKETEIYADINQSQITGAMGGGLIWALVDSSVNNSRTKKAEAGIAPVRNALLDFDFDKLMTADMQADVAKVDWLHAGTVDFSKDNSADADDKLVSSASDPYTLIVDVDYHLTPDFHGLVVKTRGTFFPKNGPSKVVNGQTQNRPTDPKNIEFAENVTFQTTIPDSVLDAIPVPPKPPVKMGPDGKPLPSDQPDLDDDQQQAIVYWTQNGGQALKAALVAAASETSRIICQSLSGGEAPIAPVQYVKIPAFGRVELVEQAGNRDVVLLGDGTLLSTDASDATPVQGTSAR